MYLVISYGQFSHISIFIIHVNIKPTFTKLYIKAASVEWPERSRRELDSVGITEMLIRIN